MATPSPLQKFHEAANAEWVTLTPVVSEPAEQEVGGEEEGAPRSIRLVATYHALEAEYAAIRKSVGLLDLPNRGTLVVKGNDAVEFLNRMLTNEVKPVVTGQVVRTFFLNRQGRILGDLLLFSGSGGGSGGGEIYIDLDALRATEVRTVFEGYLFGEEVEFTDISSTYQRLALHGPNALALLGNVLEDDGTIFELADGQSTGITVAGHSVVVVRRDTTGEIGLELTCPTAAVVVIHEKLRNGAAAFGIRPVGWRAYNMARLEAGTPIFQVDFGTDSLPHETGDLLHKAVSFTKGCYPGQEIVARMASRSHPAKILAGLKLVGEQIPTTGAPVYEVVGEAERTQGGAIIGAVTSAAPSPMLGNIGIAFAMIRYDCTKRGAKVLVGTADGAVAGSVHSLQFWVSD